MTDASDYQFWTNAVEGVKQPIHPNEFWPGFWKMKWSKTGDWVAVATWRNNDGEVVGTATKEGQPTETAWIDVANRWTYFVQYPVPKWHYDAYRSEGRWPGDAPSIGHNEPPSDEPAHRALQRALEDELEKARDVASPTNEDEAVSMAAWMHRISKIRREADTARKKEKAPTLNEGRRIDQLYMPTVNDADDLVNSLRPKIGQWMNANGVKSIGEIGTKVSLGREITVEINNWEGAFKTVAHDETLREAVVKAVIRAVKAGKLEVCPPGMEIHSTPMGVLK